jgi:hypothetical protein
MRVLKPIVEFVKALFDLTLKLSASELEATIRTQESFRALYLRLGLD